MLLQGRRAHVLIVTGKVFKRRRVVVVMVLWVMLWVGDRPGTSSEILGLGRRDALMGCWINREGNLAPWDDVRMLAVLTLALALRVTMLRLVVGVMLVRRRKGRGGRSGR